MSLALAFAIGISIASIPGPMIVLIATETLRRGMRAGISTMMAPLLLDAVIMVPLGFFVQTSIIPAGGALALGAAGAGFLFYLGFQSLRAGAVKKPLANAPAAGANRELPSFWKGVFTHLTSPYPYLYWGTVGGAFIRDGLERGGLSAAAVFPLGFWMGASCFTLITIYLVARGQRLLSPRREPYLHYACGVLLFASGILLLVRIWRGVG